MSPASKLPMSATRILLSINVRWWNAEAAYALNLAIGLQAEGCQVWMIVNPGSPVHLKAEERGIPVITDIRLDAVSPLTHGLNLTKLLVYIDSLDIQLINSFKSNGAFLFSLVRRLRPGVCYIKTRGEARSPRRNIFNRFLYGTRACDGIVAVGSPVQKWLQNLGLEKQHIKIIHYGGAGIEPTSDKVKRDVRRGLNIRQDVKVLTLLGRTQSVKGHRLLLEAMVSLKSKPWHLLFLVKDLEEFPEELTYLEGFIGANDLRDRVTILGFQDNLAQVLSITDLGVIPSLGSEVNCRVAVEFFSMGRPVLAFPTGTLPDIVRHEGNGYLTREKTAEELVLGIRWLILDEDRLRRLGESAQQDYGFRYTLEKMTQDTLNYYNRCCR